MTGSVHRARVLIQSWMSTFLGSRIPHAIASLNKFNIIVCIIVSTSEVGYQFSGPPVGCFMFYSEVWLTFDLVTGRNGFLLGSLIGQMAWIILYYPVCILHILYSKNYWKRTTLCYEYNVWTCLRDANVVSVIKQLCFPCVLRVKKTTMLQKGETHKQNYNY